MFFVHDNKRKRKLVTRSKALVIDNRDPERRGRIRVEHPFLGLTAWIPYLRTPGMFDVPRVNDIVYIEADAGHSEFTIAWGNLTKGPTGAPELPTEFSNQDEVVPQNKGMFTEGGHIFEMHDGKANPSGDPASNEVTTEKRGVRITTIAGNKIHVVEDEVSEVQHILLETPNGNLIKLDYKDNVLSINSIGTTQFDTAEDRTDTVGGNLTVTVTGNVDLTCTDATVTASGNITADAGGNAEINAGGDANITAGGAALIDSGSTITLTAASNSVAPGGVVTDNTINNDPITGIPLVGVGGTDAN